MNTQKIQTRGFTLVELIVVITILVILGTIAFINLGGQSAAARDSKRTSDVRNLVSQVNIKQTSGVGFMDMINSGATNQLLAATLNLAGTGGTQITYGTDYQAGAPNYTVLGLSPDNFKDPLDKTKDYPMATTTFAGGAYQIAASLEGDNSKSALVMGTYSPRNNTTYGSGVASAVSGGTYTITLTTGVGLFKKGDWIRQNTTNVSGTGVIASVSSDLKTLTVTASTAAASGTGFALITSEVGGLIKNTAGTNLASSGVVNGSGGTLPY